MNQDQGDFFVGYLPVPTRLRRFAAVSGAVFGVFLLIAGVALAKTTRAPARAQLSETEEPGALGVFHARPAATLFTLDPSVRGGVRGTLLVGQGKFGLDESAAELDGKAVRAAGSLIERDGQRMLELSSPLAAAGSELSSADQQQIGARAAETLGEITVRGEIVDSKCYLGRMRPGDRRTHRACAQQCIAGGIPPLLVSHDALGEETQYLLATREGAALSAAILPFVAEPVAVTGRVLRDGDLLVLQTAADQITRL